MIKWTQVANSALSRMRSSLLDDIAYIKANRTDFALRIEDSQGRGCYAGKYIGDWSIDMYKHYDSAICPSPEDDAGVSHFAEGTHFFGFKDVDQLSRWFDIGELFRLHKLGYHIAIYEATDVLYGNHQVAFNLHESYAFLRMNIHAFLTTKERIL